MGKQIDKIKAKEQLSPQEILAGLIWDRALNSRDRIFRSSYFGFPCYIEYCHEYQDDGFRLDCLYLGQEQSFMLIQPKFRDVLGAASQILEWLKETYMVCCPPEPPRPKKSGGKRASAQPSRGQNRAGKRVQKGPQKTPQNGIKKPL